MTGVVGRNRVSFLPACRTPVNHLCLLGSFGKLNSHTRHDSIVGMHAAHPALKASTPDIPAVESAIAIMQAAFELSPLTREFCSNLLAEPIGSAAEMRAWLAKAFQEGWSSTDLGQDPALVDQLLVLQVCGQQLVGDTNTAVLPGGGYKTYCWSAPREKHPDYQQLYRDEQDALAGFSRRQPMDCTLSTLLRLRDADPGVKAIRHITNSGKWNYLMDPAFFAANPAVTRFLQDALSQQPVIEIGVGANYQHHAILLRDVLGVGEYSAVDARGQSEPGVTISDALEFVSNRTQNYGSVMAFGFFNEPFAPSFNNWREFGASSALDFEYAARFAFELSRIVPAGGVVFGDGFHPMRFNRVFESILLKAGFRYAVTPMQALMDNPANEHWVVDPFIFERI